MSVICAVNFHNRTWIACDSFMSMGDRVLPSRPKWLFSESVALGICGSDGRVFNVLDGNWSGILEKEAPKGTVAIMSTVRDILFDDGLMKQTEAGFLPELKNVSMILVTRDTVYCVDNDFGIDEIPENFLWAEGSGAGFTMAAFAALVKYGQIEPIDDMVKKSIEIAAELEVHVSPPVWCYGLLRG